MATAETSASTRTRPPTRRRQDIEGLRLVAVGLVAIYHYTQAGVSGGVDVFLFLSGYLVLGSLARRLARGERAGLGDFYFRTARRLLPMAWLAATVTILGSLVVAGPGDLVQLGQQFLASMLYVENSWLAEHQVTYGASSTYLNPFQHFWSLSVQLQVFVVAPLLLVLVARLARVRVGRPKSMTVPVLMLAVVATGLGWWLTARDQAEAYFSTPARGWEFLAGAMLALVTPHVRLRPWLRVVLGWSGLALLGVTGLLLDGVREFPGPSALVPLAAAAAVILAGTESTRGGVDRLLGARPLARCGRYAYGLYLWHWPVMSLWLLATGAPRLSARDAVVVVAFALALTVGSHHLVETRLRPATGTWSIPTRVLAGVMTVGILCSAGVVVRAYREDVRWTREVNDLAAAADLSTHPGAMSVYMPTEYEAPEGMLAIPLPQEAVLDEDAVPSAGCQVVADEPELWCLWGLETDYGDTADVVLLGGSHSGAWLVPTQLVGEQLGWHVRAYIRTGCPFVLTNVLDIADYYDPDWTNGCNAWNDKLMAELETDPPDLVVTTYSRPFGPDGEPEWLPDEYLDVWSRLDELGTRVLAIRANAQLPTAGVCATAEPCAFERSEIYGDDELTAAELPANVRVLDMTQYACENGVCPSVIGNVRVYADQTHLTNSYGRTAWPIVYDFVKGAFPDMS